ncbi:unnamed protein product [Sphagnum jensenii]|uniref:Uncharacterized protein n=1 Tax=Sphagnum jensenii TaxID=128206 RepID=A0ABP0VYU9_9BRYO
MQSMQQQIVNLLSIQSRFQKENVEALLKEANNFSLEFEELPRLEQLASLGKTWLEPVRKLLAPIKALWNHGLVPGLEDLEQCLANAHAWLPQAKPALDHTRTYSYFGASIIGDKTGYSFAKDYTENTFLATEGCHCGAFLWAFSFLHRGPT